MEEVLTDADKVVIDCIEKLLLAAEPERNYPFDTLDEVSSLVFRQEKYVHSRCFLLISFPLKHSDSRAGRDHSCEDGSLYPEEYVVSCDNLGVYAALSEGLDRLSRVFL